MDRCQQQHCAGTGVRINLLSLFEFDWQGHQAFNAGTCPKVLSRQDRAVYTVWFEWRVCALHSAMHGMKQLLGSCCYCVIVSLMLVGCRSQ